MTRCIYYESRVAPANGRGPFIHAFAIKLTAEQINLENNTKTRSNLLTNTHAAFKIVPRFLCFSHLQRFGSTTTGLQMKSDPFSARLSADQSLNRRKPASGPTENTDDPYPLSQNTQLHYNFRHLSPLSNCDSTSQSIHMSTLIPRDSK